MEANIPDFMPVLSRGAHPSPAQGACVMEMVSYLAGEDWSDHPSCTHKDIAFVAQRVNDTVSDDNRAKIALMIPRLIGTGVLQDDMEFQRRIEEIPKEFSEFLEYPNTTSCLTAVQGILNHFKTEQDESKRLTNEEYDDKMMLVLTRMLDVADELLGRNEYEVTTDEAFAKIAELPNQKVGA